MQKVVLIFILSIVAHYTQGQLNKTKIDSVLSQYNDSNSPGFNFGIIKNGELVYFKNEGLANLEHQIPNTVYTSFRIASTSKQFTAACIMLLIQRGSLKLNTNLSEFYPSFPIYAQNISIENLLNHTSGIKDYLTLFYLKGYNENSFINDKDIEIILAAQKGLNFDPGEKYLYSNSGYLLLGQIVEKISGKSLSKFAHEEIFSPLKMYNTYFVDDNTQIIPNRANGYSPTNDGGFRLNMTKLENVGAGGVFTTIQDLLKWDLEYYNRKILNNDSWILMTSPGKLNNGIKINYAFGLGIGNFNGLKTISHRGAFVGFRANLMRFPERSTSIMLLANRSDIRTNDLIYSVAEIIFADNLVTYNQKKNLNIESLNNLEQLEKFTGKYWDKSNKCINEILIQDKTLYYIKNQGAYSRLTSLGNNIFKLGDHDNNQTLEIKLIKNKPIFIQVVDKKKVIEKSYPLNLISSIENNYLKKFTGTFNNSELDTEYSIRFENSELKIYVNNTYGYVLTPITTFLFQSSLGYLEFDMNDDIINGFSLSNDRAKEITFIKLN